MTHPACQIRRMGRSDLNMALCWAAREGWNPGLHDADCFYAADPDGFLIGLLDDERIVEQREGLVEGLGATHAGAQAQSVRQLLADAAGRVERGQWVLKNRPNLAAPNVAHLVGVQVVYALAFQQNLATRHTAWRLQQANDGGPGQRLAGTRLAHHTQDFAGCDVERNVVQRTQRAVAAGEFHHQVFDL